MGEDTHWVVHFNAERQQEGFLITEDVLPEAGWDNDSGREFHSIPVCPVFMKHFRPSLFIQYSMVFYFPLTRWYTLLLVFFWAHYYCDLIP